MAELIASTRRAPALAIDSLSYRYATATSPSLRDVSLEIGAGELVLLAGRSASGKTTLLRAACGLVPHFHGGEIDGTVAVAGVDAIATGPGELAAHVGYLAQDPETQVVSTTVAAEIGLPLEMRGDSPTQRARAVEEVALALAIPQLLPRAVDTLSGGELQRVALAAALVSRPSLVLLDEPTSQLDPVAGDELIWLLRRLNEEWGTTILLAEHRLERCLAAADRVVAMDSGRISFDGTPRGFLSWAGASDPALETPAARMFSLAGLSPLPVGVRDARRLLAEGGRVLSAGGEGGAAVDPRSSSAPLVPRRHPPELPERGTVVRTKGLWIELGEGEERRDVIKGLELQVSQGERVALMGRNGAGKSTLLRTIARLVEPVKGRINLEGEMALLTQNPSDYLVRERVGDELPGEEGAEALRIVGLEHAVDLDPRDLSGGERQRLALAITLAGRIDGGNPPAVVGLDEPTRGMDRALKDDLVELVVLLGDGDTVADGPAAEVLSGGWYFATEVARVLDLPGVITPEQGAEVLGGEGD
jgi:energy-coupling factor transporter ATP-binding protein EcfA2